MTQKTNAQQTEQKLKGIRDKLFDLQGEFNDALYNKKITSYMYSEITTPLLNIIELVDDAIGEVE